MRKAFIVTGIITASLSLFSCNDASVGPNNSPILSEKISVIENVQWTLASAMTGGIPISVSEYEPFHLLIGDSTVYGDDGCNSYFGRFSMNNDSLIIGALFATAMECGNGRQFDHSTLQGEWKVALSDSTLIIKRGVTTLFFASDYSMPVADLPFLGRDLRLFYSNDTSFYSMSRANMLPILNFEPDRTFELKWNIQPAGTIFPYNLIAGSFCISSGKHILLYSTAESYSTSNISSYGAGDLFFQQRIVSSTTFTYSLGSVTLSGGPDGFYYTFVGE